MDQILESIKTSLHYFLVFNENSIYFILYFLKNYWIYLIVVAAIGLMVYFELKEVDEKFIEDKRRVV